MIVNRISKCGLSFEAIEGLFGSDDIREAASNLFSVLHRLAKSGLDIIYAEFISKKGLRLTISERLKK